VSNRLYRFNNKKTWNDVFDEVTDPEEVDLKKKDQILVTVSDRAGQTFEPDMEESGAPKKKEKKKNLPTYMYLPRGFKVGRYPVLLPV
jgi:spermidine/putrescine-binding protein